MTSEIVNKFLIALFMILNILVLSFGYFLLDETFLKKEEASKKFEEEKLAYIRKEEQLVLEKDILSKSNLEISSNIKTLDEKIKRYEEKVELQNETFNSLDDEKVYYEDKILSVSNENELLVQEKLDLENTLEEQKIQEQLLIEQELLRQQELQKQQQKRKRTRSS